VSYAKASRHTTLECVTVQIDQAVTNRIRKNWNSFQIDAPLVIIDSPYREVSSPFVTYVEKLYRQNPREMVAVYLPEYILGHWWERFLHNRVAARIRSDLMEIPGVVVIDVPWHLPSAQKRHGQQNALSYGNGEDHDTERNGQNN